ncbi:MAG: hypothetical protein AAF638_02370 [Pseudomonadota bacterium]
MTAAMPLKTLRNANAYTVVALVLLAAMSTAQADSPTRGEAIAVENCARCHAIGAIGESTHAEAPPFRRIVTF